MRKMPVSPWIVVWAAMACPAAAQVVTGSISGTVHDSSAVAVANAQVKATSATTGASRDATTDSSGGFAFSAMPPDTYTVTVEHAGFKKYERKNVQLPPSERLSVGVLQLELGAVVETVTVTATGASVQTASGERSGVVTPDQVENLTIINRDFSVLLTLQPGVVDEPTDQNESFGSVRTFNVQGSRDTSNNITIDGAPVENSNARRTGTFVSMDSVATVKILTSNFQAEFGRKPGAGIQAITKAGTKQFHGIASWYKRHEQFNANSFFNNRLGVPEARYRYTTAGFNIGGPIYIPGKLNRNRDKLFFFFSTEHLREQRPQAIRQLTMPTAAERTGDFSQSRDTNGAIIPVRDPLNNRQPFAGNVAPSSRINPNGRNYLRLLPVPNFFDVAISAYRYNYQYQESLAVPKHLETYRLDYNLNSNNIVYLRINNWTESVKGAATPNTNTNWGWLPNVYKNFSKTALLSATHIFSPTVILEASMGAMRWLEDGPPLDPSDTDRLNRTKAGVSLPQFHPENNPLNLVPGATFGGLNSPGNPAYEGRFPLRGAENIFNWNAVVTRTQGAHVSKAGLWAEHNRFVKGESGNFTGRFDFTRDNNNANESNHPYANALLGNFTSYTEASSRPALRERFTNIDWFVQDNWRALRRLTLDFGVRFGWSQPFHSTMLDEAVFVPSRWNPSKAVKLIQPVRVGNSRVGLNPVTNQVAPATAIGALAPGSGDPFNGTVVRYNEPGYTPGMRNASGLKMGPRFGFAYDPFGKGTTAVRGGFGLFYEMKETDNFVSINTHRNPPLQLNPIIYYGDFNSLLSLSGFDFPSATVALDTPRPLARIMNYSFGVQQRVGFQTIVDVAYVGSLGRHLLQTRNANAIPFGSNWKPEFQDATNPGRPLPAAFLRPYLGYNDITYTLYDGNSNYHSLQAMANRRFARGLQFGAAWTWSKAMDYSDNIAGLVSTLVDRQVWNYGRAGFDRTHILKLNWTWDVPRMPAAWKNPVLRQAFNGWQVSGIATFQSGPPSGISFGSTVTNANEVSGSPTDAARVMVIAKPNIPRGERNFSHNFNVDAFAAPATGAIGNATKDVVRSGGINNWDLSLFKNFGLFSERWKMQFRGEFYNAFNHTQFSTFDTATRFDGQGRQTNTRLSEYTAARQPRRVQLALRLTF
jgi:hypothetical protein